MSEALSAVVDTVYYSCKVADVTSAWGQFHPGVYSPGPSVWQEALGLFVVNALLLVAACFYLHRRGASPRDVFYWGALALIVPILGPLVTIIFYRFATRNDG